MKLVYDDCCLPFQFARTAHSVWDAKADADAKKESDVTTLLEFAGENVLWEEEEQIAQKV